MQSTWSSHWTSLAALSSVKEMIPLRGHLFNFWVKTVNPAFFTSDYGGHEVGIVLGSITEVSAN
jgi:hypothetical protein